MNGLKSLAVCYLAAASVFGVCAGSAYYPHPVLALTQEAEDASGSVHATLWRPMLAFASREHAALLAAPPPAPVELNLPPPEPWDGRVHATTKLPPLARPLLGALRLVPPRGEARASIAAPDISEAEIAQPPAAPPMTADAAGRNMGRDVSARLRAGLTPELLANFSLFLYVSKADHGPVAQHMYVFAKVKGGALSPLYDWAVSTGREKTELSAVGRKTLTDTPRGYYELDPTRMYRHYMSRAWKQPMPYAMFFNWENKGQATGLAIHAASGGDIQLLGSRASAGCIHLSPANAKLLFNLIHAEYRGEMPRFAYDRRTGSTSNMGALAHNSSGRVRMADGYKVLVYIENYGGENVVAALF